MILLAEDNDSETFARVRELNCMADASNLLAKSEDTGSAFDHYPKTQLHAAENDDKLIDSCKSSDDSMNKQNRDPVNLNFKNKNNAGNNS